MRIIKPAAIITLVTLLLSGCGAVQGEAEVDDKGNITDISFSGEFDKNIFNQYLLAKYVYTPPDVSFYEENPTISADMSPELQKFAVFFQEFFLETFKIETIIPENITLDYLRKACAYDEDPLFFKADCNIDVPFIVQLPLMGSVMSGNFYVEENTNIATYEGVLNNFINIESDFYFNPGFTSKLALKFPHEVTYASGAGVTASNNTVNIDLIQHNREVIEGASNIVRFDVKWEKQLEFWQTLWFKIVAFLLSLTLITRFILRTFFRNRRR